MAADAGRVWLTCSISKSLVRRRRDVRGGAKPPTHAEGRCYEHRTATLAVAISMIANFGMFFGGGNREGQPGNAILGLLILNFAPLAAMLVHMAIAPFVAASQRRGEHQYARARMAEDLQVHLAAQRGRNPVLVVVVHRVLLLLSEQERKGMSQSPAPSRFVVQASRVFPIR